MRPECWASQGSVSCSPRQSFFPWLNSYRCHTQLYAMLWKYLSSYSKLVHFCVWILFMWYQKLNVSCLVVFRYEGTFAPTAEMLSRGSRTNPLTWGSCEFTLLDSVFWDYVTKHIYIRPFGILLMERHTEIEHVLRPGLLWNCMQYKVVIPLWYFGIANGSHL